MTDYYALLGVSHTASGEEIRRAWKKMARRYHPDVSDHPEAAREFLLRKPPTTFFRIQTSGPATTGSMTGPEPRPPARTGLRRREVPGHPSTP